ncbi:MAG: PAS domain-containing protein [Chitinophagaceae bacterium]
MSQSTVETIDKSLLQKIVANAPIALYQFVLEKSGAISIPFISNGMNRANPGFEYNTVSRELNLDFSQVHPDDNQRIYDSILISAKELSLWHQEYRVVAEDGIRWHLGIAMPELNESNGDISWYGCIQDVTDKKAVETALNDANDRFYLSVQGSQDGLWYWDIINDKAFFSPKFRKIMGYADDEMIEGMDSLRKVCHPDDLMPTMKAIEDHLTKKTTHIEHEYRLKTIDGDYKWFLLRGEALWNEENVPLKAAGSLTDITQRKLDELYLKAANERYQLIAKATQDALMEIDFNSNAFIWINGNETWLHATDEVLTLETWMQNIHPDDLIKVTNIRNTFLSDTTIDNWSMEYRYKQPNGLYADVLEKSVVIRNETGKPVRLLGALKNMTDKNNILRQLQQQNKQLSEIAFQQSHLVRAPIVKMKGLIAAMQHELIKPEELPEYLNYLMQTVDELDVIVHKIVEQTQEVNEK